MLTQLSILTMLIGPTAGHLLPGQLTVGVLSAELGKPTAEAVEEPGKKVPGGGGESSATTAALLAQLKRSRAKPGLGLPPLELEPSFAWLSSLFTLVPDARDCAAETSQTPPVFCQTLSWVARLGSLLTGVERWTELLDVPNGIWQKHVDTATSTPAHVLEDSDYLSLRLPTKRPLTPWEQKCLTLEAQLSACNEPWSIPPCGSPTLPFEPKRGFGLGWREHDPFAWDRQVCLRLDRVDASRS